MHVEERDSSWSSCCSHCREREIQRGLRDLGENNETKELVVTRIPRSMYGGSKSLRKLGSQDVTEHWYVRLGGL